MSEHTFLDQALALAARGFFVFPVVADGKIPAIKGWQNRATRDPAQIRAWWTERDPVLGGERVRDLNVGIRTGRFGDAGWLVVCDVDVKAGARGRESLWDLDMLHGTPGWLETYAVDTPSGGEHYYFLTEEPAATSASKLGPGLDTRGEGGYVVAPGGLVNGVPYRSRGGTMRMAPRWLVDAIGRPAPRTRTEGNVVCLLDMQPALDRGVKWLREDAASAEQGRRGSTAYRVAAQLKDWGISELACLDMMGEHWNDDHCSPPMEFEDLAASVQHAYQYGKKPVGADNPTVDFEPVTEEEAEIPTEGTPPPISIRATPFRLRDASAIPVRQFVYGRHYIRRYVSATVAPGGVGKSSLGIVEALAMATGRPLLGVTPPARARVWLWNGEDPLEELERRITAACLHFGIAAEEIDGWLFVDSGRELELVIAQTTRDGTKVAAPVTEALVETIKANAIDVVMIDPFVSSHRVSENDNMAVDAVVKTWARIADRTGTAIDLVHHSRKTGGEEVTVEDTRGASALISATRSARVLNRMSDEEAKRAGVSHPRLFFRVDNGKANLAAPAAVADWYHLQAVALGNGVEAVDPEGDSVAVVTPWRWSSPADAVPEAHLEAILTRIRAGRWRKDPRADDWVGRAVADVLELDADDPDHRPQIIEMVKSWLAAGILRVVTGQDGKRMPKAYVEVVSIIETEEGAAVAAVASAADRGN